MNDKLIIIATSIFILISFVFLSAVERKQSDINAKNVWMIYFENPKNDSLDFIIENHSTDTNFHWQIMTDKTVTNQGDVIIKIGETKKISVSPTNVTDKKVSIVVSAENNKKEIYKSL